MSVVLNRWSAEQQYKKYSSGLPTFIEKNVVFTILKAVLFKGILINEVTFFGCFWQPLTALLLVIVMLSQNHRYFNPKIVISFMDNPLQKSYMNPNLLRNIVIT